MDRSVGSDSDVGDDQREYPISFVLAMADDQGARAAGNAQRRPRKPNPLVFPPCALGSRLGLEMRHESLVLAIKRPCITIRDRIAAMRWGSLPPMAGKCMQSDTELRIPGVADLSTAIEGPRWCAVRGFAPNDARIVTD